MGAAGAVRLGRMAVITGSMFAMSAAAVLIPVMPGRVLVFIMVVLVGFFSFAYFSPRFAMIPEVVGPAGACGSCDRFRQPAGLWYIDACTLALWSGARSRSGLLRGLLGVGDIWDGRSSGVVFHAGKQQTRTRDDPPQRMIQRRAGRDALREATT